MTTTGDNQVNILWTGGWDSTFRVLQLLLTFKARVQPYYIQEKERKSTLFENRTMEIIRTSLDKNYGVNEEFLQPTIRIDKESIQDNLVIRKSFYALSKYNHLGDQYEWLARMASQYQVSGLELCLVINDSGQRLLAPNIVYISDKFGGYFKVSDNASIHFKNVFGNFRFPVINLSKKDIGNIARDNGFAPLLNHTWFCHRPHENGSPCGVCYPCQHTIEEGFQHRLPNAALIRYRILKPYLIAKRKLGVFLRRRR